MSIEKELALTRGPERTTARGQEIKQVINPNISPVFLGRPSVLNGPQDYSTRGGMLEEQREAIIESLWATYDDAEAVYKLALAEWLKSRLAAEELSNEEIGTYLEVTVNTVKFHSKNIFKKLGVNSRRMAVKRARELGIL